MYTYSDSDMFLWTWTWTQTQTRDMLHFLALAWTANLYFICFPFALLFSNERPDHVVLSDINALAMLSLPLPTSINENEWLN